MTSAAKRLPPRLLALSPGDLQHPGDPRFFGALRAALGAGLPGLLLREPLLSDREFMTLGQAVRALDEGLWLGIHDRLHLAGALRAQGAHLGFRSLPVEEAASTFGAGLCLGLSTHQGDDPARWSAADYLFHGPVFRTPSKPPGSPGHRPAIGIEGLERAAGSTERGLWALGGLQPEHVQACLGAGCQGLAVLSGILGSPDPAAATQRYLSSF